MTETPQVPDSSIYFGRVMHKRLKPMRHKLDYRVFSIFVDIDRLEEMDAGHRFFGYNRFAPISFHDKDHGPRDGRKLRPWIESILAERGIGLSGGPIRLLCFPRLWGYVFNPLSIYFCYGHDGHLRAILYEVSNTFGEWHGYLLEADADSGRISQRARKVFHVSPFIEMDCTYRFRLTPPDDRLNILIRQEDSSGEELLLASHVGKREVFSDRAILSAILSHPLMTLKVTAAIHWEALKLWLKGAKYIAKPKTPEQEITG